jgi:hypothetical protein
MIAAIVVVIIACGGKAPPSPTPAPAPAPVPGGNQPPIISSLTPAQTQVYPSGLSEIQCVASDPDGDKLNITWAATGGSFSGAGYVVSWQAPEQYGTYEITATANDGKGGTAQMTITISVGANQSPQITSLTVDPSTIGPSGTAIVTCIASDPDGDVVTYNWSANEGNITGVGNKVTWVAPGKDGTFNITVTVTDGKGGEVTGNVGVTVALATRTVTLNPIAEETGTVSEDGNRDISMTKAGDDENNVGYRAFWNFNILSLQGNDIKDAKLIFTTRQIIGNPFKKVGAESLGGLRLWKVNYSNTLPQFNIIGEKLQKSSSSGLYEQLTVLDVTPEIGHSVQAGSARFGVAALFNKLHNTNNVSEWIEWSDVKLEITFTER